MDYHHDHGHSSSRFLFPDMFSFTFEPEILTFLWGLCAEKRDQIANDYRRYFPASSLLQIFVPEEGEKGGVLGFLKYTVITGTTVVFVGFSSYGTFKLLQKLRKEGVSGIRRRVETLLESTKWRKFIQSNTRTLALVLKRVKGKEKSLSSPTPSEGEEEGNFPLKRQRPCELWLNNNGGTNPSLNFANVLQHRLNGNNAVSQRDEYTLAPVNCDIASGEENLGEVKGQYFGPMSGMSLTNSPGMGSLSSSPPPYDVALRKLYPSRVPPGTPCLPAPPLPPGSEVTKS